MTRTTNVVAVLIVTVGLLAIAAAQTRSQNHQGQTGRYQLLSAQYRWPGVDAQSKVVFDEGEHLFRIDSVTGETPILLFRAASGQNGQLQTFWSPLGK
jgi:opacity protein-like surface antigen